MHTALARLRVKGRVEGVYESVPEASIVPLNKNFMLGFLIRT